MSEEKKEEEQPGNDNANGNKQESSSPIEQANAAAERMEEAIRKTEELLSRQENLIAKQMLGGRSEAGTEEVPKFTEEELAQKERIRKVGITTGAQWAKKEDGN